MKLEDFKSGKYIDQGEYRTFSPSLINLEWTWDDSRINTLLERATSSLAALNAFSLIVPDVDIFILMHIMKEASSSSRIEGTITTLEEELMDIKLIEPEKHDS